MWILCSILCITNVYAGNPSLEKNKEFPKEIKVPEGVWYQEVTDKQITREQEFILTELADTFNPDDYLTKEEIIFILIRAMGHKLTADEEDLSHQQLMKMYLMKAKEYDIYPKDESNLKEMANRGYVAKVLFSVLKKLEKAQAPKSEQVARIATYIADFDKISPQNQLGILVVYDKGLMRGYPDYTFRAKESVTCGEIIVILHRLWHQQERLPKITQNNPKEMKISNGDAPTGSWYRRDGAIQFPPNNGAVAGTEKEITLIEGTLLGRYGKIGDKSNFVTRPGVDPSRLALPPFTDPAVYQEFVVVKDIAKVRRGEIAPWGDSTGGGIQYELPEPIRVLIQKGYLEPR